jgi:hypothetical protein
MLGSGVEGDHAEGGKIRVEDHFLFGEFISIAFSTGDDFADRFGVVTAMLMNSP